MAQSKHTPGPWMAASAPSSVVGWPVVGPMGRSICNVSWMPRKVYPDISDADYAAFNAECEANARLIAAAPELLAEAIELLRNAEYADGVATVLTQDCEALQAAIAKAEGGAS